MAGKYETDEYRRNLKRINEATGYRKVLSLKEIREYLGVGDNRTLARRYGITKSCTAETLAVKLAQ